MMRILSLIGIVICGGTCGYLVANGEWVGLAIWGLLIYMIWKDVN